MLKCHVLLEFIHKSLRYDGTIYFQSNILLVTYLKRAQRYNELKDVSSTVCHLACIARFIINLVEYAPGPAKNADKTVSIFVSSVSWDYLLVSLAYLFLHLRFVSSFSTREARLC